MQNLEKEVRQLWANAHHSFTDDEIEIFFDELFDAEATVAVRRNGRIVACGQWGERKMTFVGQSFSIGYVFGLMVDASLKPADRSACLAEVLAEIHRQQYFRGMMCSLILPLDSKQRQWLEQHDYMIASHRLTAEVRLPENFTPDVRIEVTEAEEWGRDLWLYYVQHGGKHDFELSLAESDFFAMIARHDAHGGQVYVARRHGKIVGLALARREGKPLKNGKISEKQFRMNFNYVLATDATVLSHLQASALASAPDCKHLVMVGGCPAKGFKGAEPQAMMRSVCVEKFLYFVAKCLPGLQLTATIEADSDLPDNIGTYRLRDGHCYVSPFLTENRMTPGSIPAMLLAGQPVQVPFV